MSKISKLLLNPGCFLRDYFLKRYPPEWGGYKVTLDDKLCAERFDSKLLITNEVSGDIDAVYTWVDDKDEKWRQKKDHFLKLSLQNHDTLFPESINDRRFKNHNELYFSIISLRKFAPWIRNIFIITDEQIPSLNNFDKVVIIDHKEIIDEEYLPTFNSHVIESHLHKIPGLSQNFIYFNDDIFLAKAIKKQHFFRENGLASLFLANRSLRDQYQKGRITPTLQASFNSIKLINQYLYPNFIDKPLLHTYIPLNKKFFDFCYVHFFEYIKSFSKNKFRAKNDLNMASFFVPWVMYLRGMSFENVDLCYYININSPSFYNAMANLHKDIGTQFAPHSFCLNDVEMNNKNNSNSEIQIYLEKLFNN